jgi:hypothetical protein
MNFSAITIVLVLIAASTAISPGRASAWNYGCNGTLPVFDNSETIIFNRALLVLQPTRWLKGTLRDFIERDATDDTVAIAQAKDENSGLAQTMMFTLLDHPDKKLTLTEKSSKTISDSREKMDAPRFVQITTYTKVYRYISDFGYMGPFDVKMECMNYRVSAPIR